MLANIIGPNHIKHQLSKKTFIYLFLSCILLAANLALQLGFGLYLKSGILIATALHTTVDMVSILAITIVLLISLKPNTTRKTYGFSRLETLVGFFNGLLLLFIAVPFLFGLITTILFYFNPNLEHFALLEIFHSHSNKQHDSHNPINNNSSTLVLTISLINFVSHSVLASILYFYNKNNNVNKNILIESSLLHVLNDVFASLIAILGAVLLIYTNTPIIDKLVALLLVALIIKLALKMLFKTSDILLESTPKNININNIKTTLEAKVAGLISIYHIHIWQLNEEEVLASAIIYIDNLHNYLAIKAQIKEILAKDYNIKHIVIELSDNIKEHNCN